MVSLSTEDLAERSGIPAETVARLVELGIITTAEDGSFRPPDVYRVRLLAACDRRPSVVKRW
jgi:hypothetical protein